MKMYAPQVRLFKETNIDGSEEFTLVAVTFSHFSNTKENGFRVDGLSSNGIFKVNLFIDQDSALPSISILTPVVHVVPLGVIPFQGQGRVEAQISLSDGSGSSIAQVPEYQTRTTTSSSNTSADEIDRPTPDDPGSDWDWVAG